MIIYSLICNKGGMLRVVESLEKIFDYLPPNFPLKIIIIGEEKPFEMHDERFIWFESDDVSTATASRKSLVRISQEIKVMFEGQKVDWIITDFMTLDCFRHIDAKICYDVHFLGRPFFNSFSKQKDLSIVSEFTGDKLIYALHVQHLKFLKFEAKLMDKASCFIVNSESSRRSLLTEYKDVTQGKEMTLIPVSTQLEEQEMEKPKILKKGFYFHARFHPQKGVHFLLQQNWSELGLTMRGIDPSYFKETNLNFLKERSIEALPWTNDSSIIRDEILSYEFVLFPSIYEPWGLSLQEALSLGKICIAHKCHSGHEEQITHGLNGFLLDFAADNLMSELERIKNLPSTVKDKIQINAAKMSKQGHGDRQKMLSVFFEKLLSSG